MTRFEYLTQVQRDSCLELWTIDASAATNAATEWLNEWGLTVRMVRGVKMRTTAMLMDEVGAALQFPYYFGENWAALDECLSDMEWLPPSRGIVLVVRDAVEVLMDDSAKELQALVAAFRSASKEYAQPIELGEAWDRPAVPFHVVLLTSAAERSATAKRWAAAGAQFSP